MIWKITHELLSFNVSQADFCVSINRFNWFLILVNFWVAKSRHSQRTFTPAEQLFTFDSYYLQWKANVEVEFVIHPKLGDYFNWLPTFCELKSRNVYKLICRIQNSSIFEIILQKRGYCYFIERLSDFCKNFNLSSSVKNVHVHLLMMHDILHRKFNACTLNTNFPEIFLKLHLIYSNLCQKAVQLWK